MSSLTVEEDQKWLPTQVQVTVLRGRGLRGKGKHGTSDVYTIIQLGKEKYSTGVVEKTTEPEWREECSFELQPGVLQGGGRNGGCPAGATELVLIVMHRAHMGMDVFLGQVVIQLDKLFHESRCVKNEWYKLNSKSGKKEKERGEIQATVQFTRNNLTASMYDLVMTDKTASTFGKLKERIKGKKRSSEEDSSSAVLPSGYGSLHRMRQRLPSDGGGEEDYEDDEGGEARRSKMRTFFLRGKLRKSSDTRSSTSLGSESSESSRGGSLSPTAGISMVVSDLSNSPSNSSNLSPDNSPEHTANSLQCEFGDDAGEISIIVPPLPTAWVNGGDAYSDLPLDKGSVNPVDCLGLPPLQKSLPLSVSLQNLRPASAAPKSPMGDGRRWSFDKPDEEEKAAIAAALEKSGPMLGDEEEEEEEEGLGYAAQIKSSSTVESGKKQRRNFFSHGRGESAGKGQSRGKDESEQAPAAEEKHKGWFGSKDSNSKPSARPPIAQLFPQASNPYPTLNDENPTAEDSSVGTKSDAKKRPLPPPPTYEDKPLNVKSSDHFMSAGALEPEWDESFEAFAAGRLQSPEDLTTDCKTQQNTLSEHSPEHCNEKAALQPITDQNTNVNDALHTQPCTEFVFDTQKSNAYHLDTFAHSLETIPEHTSFENDNDTLNTSTNSPIPDAFTDPHQTNAATNTNDVTDTNVHPSPGHASSVKLSSSSPDPTSSGLGSSAEEDFLSCVSSYSDKFSASSSEEAETQNFESSILGFEKSSDSSVVRKPSESEDDVTDRSIDLDLGNVSQHVMKHGDGDEKTDLEGILAAPMSTVLTNQQSATEIRSESPIFSYFASELQPKSYISLQPDNEKGKKGINKEEAEKRNFESSTFGSFKEEESVAKNPSESEVDTTDQSICLSLDDEAQHNVIQHSDGGENADLDGSLVPTSPKVTHQQPVGETGSKGADTQSPNLSYFSPELQPLSKIYLQPNNENGKEGINKKEEAEKLNFERSIVGFCEEEESVEGKPSESEVHITNRSDDQSLAQHHVTQHRDGGEKADVHGIQGSLGPMSPVLTHRQPAGETGSEDAADLLPELHTKPNIFVQSVKENGKKGNSSAKDFVSDVSPFSGKFPAFSLEESEEQNFESSVLRFSKEESVVKKPPKSEEDTTDGSNDLSLVDLAKHNVIQHWETDEKADLDGIEGSLAPLSPVISHQQPAGDTGSEDASSFSNLLTELHTKSDISLQPDNEKGKDIGEMNTSVEDFSKLLNDSSISEINTPDDKLYSTQPSLRIITSSPDVRHGSSDSPIESTGLGGQDASQRSVVPFGLFDDFLNTSPSQDFDDTMLHTPASDQSTSSFLHSLYVSTNSQDYQTCVSQPSSSGSEKNETLHSANSTLCGDLIEIQTTPEAALDQKDSRSHPFHEEFDNIGGSFFGAKDTTPTLKPSFMIEDNFGLLSAASTDLYKSYNPWNLDDEAVEYQHVVLGDMFSKSPQAQSTTLPRSHSEGTLTPAFEDLLQPSYGSDPGAIQASSSAPPLSLDLPSLTSFAPSLTPSSSSSFSLPFLYNATARSPPSTAMLEEMHRQQQAANQQNSPHPVKPLTTTTSAEEKRTEGRSVLATGLEKLKSSISPGRSSQLSEQETSKKKPVSEGAGSYFHLNHSELVALLVQREAELERQEDEFKRQKRLLAKREVELKKLKPQVKDLEDYIDTLLVRIMEQKPTLLQVRSKLK
ncbi:rab11 family-interacting protein 1 isoform X2 [Gymnodraco acuticeps]|uniref:Rab11 family-interacting protein 1 isoform X2 n=1 Tax=Gymnodraco acuticeps TaxID=8218 RepID=A0A6P8VYS8_GYMAC|nr:rab11 family-interacting protein 1 isoform X2 [Gymnodraco acuticeps]